MEDLKKSNRETVIVNNVGVKRKAVVGEEECKKPKLETEEVSDCGLLMFSDDILLMIILNLNHKSVLMLSQTCDRLFRICQDHTLWRNVDFGQDLVTTAELEGILKYVGPETKAIHARGAHEAEDGEDVLTVHWLTQIREKCQNLMTLSLPYHYIDCDYINIQQFPKSLRVLDLSWTFLRNAPSSRSYFKDLSLVLPDLETLILSNCQWFEPHSLMALSKCPKLTELRLDGCVKMKDCVAYCGLATRSGFQSLRTLDLRKCPIGSSELICFASVTSIINLYLDNPYQEERFHGIGIDAPILILFTNEPMIEIRPDGHRMVTYPRLKIERLVVRNFMQMTDSSLHQLAKDAVCLQYLDVTGSGITMKGLQKFRKMRPGVQLVHNIAG